MRIGVFADTHNHLDNIRRAVEYFNRAECEYVIFAGDLVSTIAVPPLRNLTCPLVGCFGDNEGNKVGLLAGMRTVGVIGEPPLGFRSPDGVRFIIAHMYSQIKKLEGEFEMAVYGHTHKARIRRDERGRLHVNPGETSGWSFGRPTIAMLETGDRSASIIDISESQD
jgi:hypothetical protein